MYPGHAANSPLIKRKTKQVPRPLTYLYITQPSSRSCRRIDWKKILNILGGWGGGNWVIYYKMLCKTESNMLLATKFNGTET